MIKRKIYIIFILIIFLLFNMNIFSNNEKENGNFKEIYFSGYKWNVKKSNNRIGPGGNFFSDSENDVYLDSNGKLHLKIIKKEDKWFCTEVFTEKIFGYGKYIFIVEGRIDNLDKNIVLGLFTYNSSEIDIEFSRWGIEENMNSQYVIQPYSEETIYRFQTNLNGDISTHILDWNKDKIYFSSYHGKVLYSAKKKKIASWTYFKDIPVPKDENVRINFYLFKGKDPSNKKNAEIVISKFIFIPYE